MSYHNNKPFVCPYCEKDFWKKRQLKNHLKDTHKQLLESLYVNSEAGNKIRESMMCLSKGSYEVSEYMLKKYGKEFLDRINGLNQSEFHAHFHGTFEPEYHKKE